MPNATKKCKPWLHTVCNTLNGNGSAFWPTLFLAAQLLYWYRPWEGAAITAFDRVMGAATAADVLVKARTSQAVFALLVLLPVVLLVCRFLVAGCLGDGRDERCRALYPTLNALSGVGLFALALRYAQTFGGEEDVVFTSAQTVALVGVLALLLWCLFRRCLPADRPAVEADTVLRAQLCALSFSFPIQLVLQTGLPTAAVYALCALAALLGCIALSFARPTHQTQQALEKAGFVLLLCLPLTLLYLECVNILNQYSIFAGPSRLPILLLLLLCLAVAVFVCFRVRKAKLPTISQDEHWKKLWYPVILAGIALLAGHSELQTYISSDFFERANSAVSISGFLNFGQLPMVETHGAHMASDSLGGIFWGLINGDSLAACFLKYQGISIALTVLVFFYLLRCCINSDAAFVAALLLPVSGISPGDWYAHLSYLPALALVWLLCNKTRGRWLLFWYCAAFSVLYRGDVGLAVGGGALLVLLVNTICCRSARQWKDFLLSGLIAGGSLGIFFALLCVIRGINPFSRLWEFLQVMALSNQNWAYEGLGTVGTAGFAWIFLIVPVALAGLLYTALLRLKRQAVQPCAAHWLFFTFTAAYLLNFPRTLVRHSLAENIPIYCLAVGMWALALGVWLLWHDRAPAHRPGGVALPALLLCTILLSGALFDSRLAAGTSLASNAYGAFHDGDILRPQVIDAMGNTTRKECVQETLPRAVFPTEMKNTYQRLEKLLNIVLGPDDTWLDFTNQSTLYALMGRRNPVFINQSPGLLSGEDAQQAFIDEVESCGTKVPVALLPQQEMLLGFSLDGVQNSLRYYRVAEYIYTHYTPYTTIDGYAVWLRTDRFDELAARAAGGEALVTNCSRISGHDATLTLEDNGSLNIVTGTDDPYLLNLETMFSDYGGAEGSINLTIQYTTTTAGTVQLYYAETGRNFEEKNSVTASVEPTQQTASLTLRIPWSRSMRIKFALPADAEVTIFSILVGENRETCGYGYASYAQAHDYQMGSIAQLWGEADTARAWENPEISQGLANLGNNLYALTDSALGGENGRYILMQLTAPADASALLNIGVRDGYGLSPLAGFHFDVSAGTHTYLVRVSCDGYWYSDLVNGLQLQPENGGFTVERIAVLDGD